MMFSEPSHMEEPDVEDTQTDRLLARINGIVEELHVGNQWRVGNIAISGISVLGLCIGSTALSPMVSLLLATSICSAVSSYLAYCLHEGQKLKIKPIFSPVLSGEDEEVAVRVLPKQEKLHYQAIAYFGSDEVKSLELRGELPALLSAMKSIRITGATPEEIKAKSEACMAQIRDHFFGGGDTPKLNRSIAPPVQRSIAPPRKSIQEPAKDAIAPEPAQAIPAPTLSVAQDFFPEEFDEPTDLPPIRDLAKEIIALNGSVLLVAKPQSGKTTLLAEVIKEGVRLTQHITVIDGKGNYHLKNAGATSYYLANTPESALKVLHVVRALLKTLATRQALEMNGHTEFTQINFVIDEINFVRRALKEARYLEEAGELDMAIGRLLLQGASVKIYLIVTSHSSRLANFGLDGGEADALSFVALGRARAYESIDDLIKYQMEGRKRQTYLERLDQVSSHKFPETLVLSTIAPLGFFRLPLVERTTPVVQDSTPQGMVVSTLNKIYHSPPAEESEDIPRSPSPTPVLDSEPSPPSFLDSLDDDALEALMSKVLEFIKRTGKGKAHEVRSGIRELRSHLSETKQLLAYLEGDGLGSFDSEKNEFTPY